MDLRQLRYFVAIVEAKSFSRAALMLNVAQPALSLHVRNMETHLGTALLVRTPQGVFPTDAGRLLEEQARALLRNFAATEQAVRDLEAEPAGVVHIGLPGTVAEMLAVPLVLQARATYPRVNLKIAEAMSGFVLSWLQEGRIDLGLLYIPVEDRNMRSTAVLTEELRLFAPAHDIEGVCTPPAGVVALEGAAALPLVLPGQGHGLRDLIDQQVEAAGLQLGTVLEVDSYKTIKVLVERGLGFSVLPANAIAPEVAAGTLRSWQLGTPPLRRTVHVVRPVDRPSSKAVLAVEQLCTETLQRLVQDGTWQLDA
ncbi:MAG: LysR family transcriptional regulator [Alkalilacustris sp.]